jgi:hypothetical protein
MRKTLLIISSMLFLVSSTELHEFLRLPYFLNHFFHHHSKDPRISFLDFIKIHYSGSHPNDNDENDDKELPFKSKGSLTYIDTPVPFRREVPGKQIFFPDKKQGIQYEDDLSDKKICSIFHPPRLA